jgi:hypothetical protein
MAKRKKGGLAGLLALVPVIVIVLAVVFLVFVSPSAEKVANKLDPLDDVSAINIGDVVTIVDSRDMENVLDFEHLYGAVITYYEDFSEAVSEAKDIKDNLSEDSDTFVWVRGNAVFVGDRECFDLFLKVII